MRKIWLKYKYEFKWLSNSTMHFECIDESGNKENKSEVSIPAADGNAYSDDPESSRSSKHN